MLKKLIDAFKSRHFALFVLYSGIAAAVNAASRVLFQTLTQNYELSIVLAYVCGMATAFYLNRNHNFIHSGKGSMAQIAKFVAINILGFAQTYLVSVWAVAVLMPALHIANFKYLFSHLLGIGAPVVTSFIGHRFITFSDKSLRQRWLDIRRKGDAANEK